MRLNKRQREQKQMMQDIQDAIVSEIRRQLYELQRCKIGKSHAVYGIEDLSKGLVANHKLYCDLLIYH